MVNEIAGYVDAGPITHALRGNAAHTPQRIAIAVLNNLAYQLGQVAIWRPGPYAGTFSEYDMETVRASLQGG
jgi:hypothetical protein